MKTNLSKMLNVWRVGLINNSATNTQTSRAGGVCLLCEGATDWGVFIETKEQNPTRRIGFCSGCVEGLSYLTGFLISRTVDIRETQDFPQYVSTAIWKGIANGNGEELALEQMERSHARSEVWELKHKISVLRDKEVAVSDNGYVYLMKRDDGCHKIGLSNDPDRRIEEIKRDHPSAELVHRIKVDDMRQAESMLHDEFSEKRKDGEWFNLSGDEIDTILHRVRFEDGWFLKRVTQPARRWFTEEELATLLKDDEGDNNGK